MTGVVAMQRCPATDVVSVDGESLELQCVHWSRDQAGRHEGDHLVHTPAVMDDHTWTNEDQLPVE